MFKIMSFSKYKALTRYVVDLEEKDLGLELAVFNDEVTNCVLMEG